MPPRTCGCGVGAAAAVVMVRSPLLGGLLSRCPEDEAAGRAPTTRFQLFCAALSAKKAEGFSGRRACQPIKLLADMGGLGGCVGERDGPVEGDAGLLAAAELEQEGTLGAVE